MAFTCPSCNLTFEDHESQPECVVGGHWTPHSSTELQPPMTTCCHIAQKQVDPGPTNTIRFIKNESAEKQWSHMWRVFFEGRG